MLKSELLEREAEARRLELASTFDELRARATPGHMLDQLVDYASSSGGVDFFRNLRDQTVANPLALGLVGAGLAWLMLSGRETDRWRRGYDPYAYDEVPRSRGEARGYFEATRERAGDAVSGARDIASGAGRLVSDTAAGVRDRISGAAAGAAHLASDAAGSIASTARSAADAASLLGEQARDRAGDTTAALGSAASALYGGVAHSAGRTASGMRYVASGTAATGRDAFEFARDQPLVLAGLGLAFGAAVGAAFPTTETEREVMGEASDEIKERAQALAAENYDKSRSAAEAIYDEFQNRGREGTASASSHTASGHASIVPPVEDETTEARETIRPERVGLRNERS
jgi:hypothetical protein